MWLKRCLSCCLHVFCKLLRRQLLKRRECRRCRRQTSGAFHLRNIVRGLASLSLSSQLTERSRRVRPFAIGMCLLPDFLLRPIQLLAMGLGWRPRAQFLPRRLYLRHELHATGAFVAGCPRYCSCLHEYIYQRRIRIAKSEHDCRS